MAYTEYDLDEDGTFPRAFFVKLLEIDKNDAKGYGQFTVARIAHGQYMDLQAVGIRSNRLKLRRAAAFALVYAAQRSRGALVSPELLALFGQE